MLAAPATASAAVVTIDAGGLATFQAAPGEVNTLSVTYGTDDLGQYVQFSDGPVVGWGGGGDCEAVGSADLRCDGSLSTVLNLGDMNDSVALVARGHRIDAGPGDDLIDVGDGGGTFGGGAGRDRITFARRTRVLRLSRTASLLSAFGIAADIEALSGSPFNDLLRPQPGTATIDGLGGADLLIGGPLADALSGGDGDDQIHGEEGNDSLAGGAGRDSIFGDGGNDLLAGGPNGDNMSGGSGRDSLLGEAGSDVIRARDNVADTVDCGDGVDRASADSHDSIRKRGDAHCETVNASSDPRLVVAALARKLKAQRLRRLLKRRRFSLFVEPPGRAKVLVELRRRGVLLARGRKSIRFDTSEKVVETLAAHRTFVLRR